MTQLLKATLSLMFKKSYLRLEGLALNVVTKEISIHTKREGDILDVTDEVLRSGQLMSGNYTAEFESWLAKKNYSKYAVTCHSGSQALEIIAEYYRQQTSAHPPRAVVPAMTYVATANAFIRAGWNVHFVDTDYYGVLEPKHIPNIDYQAIIPILTNAIKEQQAIINDLKARITVLEAK